MRSALDLSALATIAVEFAAIMAIGAAYKAVMRGRDDKADEAPDCFAHLREREGRRHD